MSGKKLPSGCPILLTVMGLLAVGTAIVTSVAHRPPAHEDLLRHANAQEAGDLLHAQLAQTPAGQRLPLLLRTADAPNPGLRLAALDALTGERGSQVTQAVERAFTDSASPIRELALRSLPTLDAPRGWLLLCAALRDSDTQIRQQAAMQIEQAASRKPAIVDRRILPALIAALDDADPIVTANITHALRALTRQGRHLSARATNAERTEVSAFWQAWWRENCQHWPSAPEFAQAAPRPPLRADAAPKLAVTDVDGQRVRMSGWGRRVILLNFWGTWCPPCRQELPDLERVHQDNRARSVFVLGLAVNEKQGPDGLKRWCAAQGLTYRQVLCSSAVQDAWGDLEGVPVSVLLDSKGRERYRWEGPRDTATFQAAIDRLILE